MMMPGIICAISSTKLEHAAAARAQLGQRVAGRRGEQQGQRDRAQPDDEAGAEVGQLLVQHGAVALQGAVDGEPGRAGVLRMSWSRVKDTLIIQ